MIAHSGCPTSTLATVASRTERHSPRRRRRAAPIHHPLHFAQLMATRAILIHGRVDVGRGRTG